MKFYIKGNVPSSKNSKMITRSGMLINSNTVRKYQKEYGDQWKDQELITKFKQECSGKEKPYKLHMFFYRDSRRRADYVNIAQYPLDLMVKNGWIDDDNMNEVVPVFDGYEVDKEKAGIIFYVE